MKQHTARFTLPSRSGQALVEFAIIAFVLTLILGAMLNFGFLLFGANVLQQAADVGAQELSRHPFPANESFENALTDSGLFDEKFLVVEIGGPAQEFEDLPENYQLKDVEALTDRMPLINRLLFSLYIHDFHGEREFIRFPGALVERNSELTVLIPIVESRNPTTGAETSLQWRTVVEEIVPIGETNGAYSLLATDNQRGSLDAGMVALRINYPHQSGAMVAYIQVDQNGVPVPPSETLGRDDLTNVPVEANENLGMPPGYELFRSADDGSIGAHAGRYGMGKMEAFATQVRPYRKVLSAQGIYRREVFD